MRPRLALLRRDRGALVLIVALASAVALVPVGARATSTDDWIYVQAVGRLVRDGTVAVPDLAVATLLFQMGWGALFALSPLSLIVATRVSTVVLFGLGGLAFYDVLRSLRVAPVGRALATGAYLFNPLAFTLAFTFMSDVPFVSLMLIATACYLRGLVPTPPSLRWVVAGSVASSCAFLVRQQGALIALAALAYVAWARGRWGEAARGLAVAAAGVPLLSLVGYVIWLRFVNGVPETQGWFIDEIVSAGIGGGAELVLRVMFIALMYIGLFVLPLTVGALRRLPAALGRGTTRGFVIAAGWVAAIVAGVIVFTPEGRLMPYVGQYVRVQGLAPDDLLGGRPPLFGRSGQQVITIVTVVAGIAAAAALARLARPARRVRHGVGIVVALAVGQMLGVLVPSFHFRDEPPAMPSLTLDRYLLPLLPYALALTAVALRGMRIQRVACAAAVALLAAVSVLGTRDALVFHDAVWRAADQARAQGIPARAIDAGAGWDGWNTSDGSVVDDAPSYVGAPWWIHTYTPRTTSEYVVATVPLDGYAVVRQRSYKSWLRRRQPVFLLRREPRPPPYRPPAAPASAPAA